jgi:hypothetical protein
LDYGLCYVFFLGLLATTQPTTPIPSQSKPNEPKPTNPTNPKVDHASLVEDLMGLAPEPANARAQMYLDMWRFPNTYTLGKNLTEKLAADYYA